MKLVIDMFKWLVKHSFVFGLRVATLFGASWAVTGLVNRELGYRIEYSPMLLIAIITIVTLRIWMPWSSTNDKER